MIGQAWLDDAQSPSLDGLNMVGLLPSQPGVPHSAGVLNGTAHVRIVKGEEVSAVCTCSPEHAHEVQSPVGVGNDVVDVCSPGEVVGDHDPKHLCTADPFQLTALDLQWGMSTPGCFREKVTIISFVLPTLSCILLLFDHSALSLATSWRLESLPVMWQHSQEAVSSTNYTRRLPSSRSLTMKRKTMGPTRVPWGMPPFTGSQSLTLCSTLTRCCQPCRKAPTHDTMNSEIPAAPVLSAGYGGRLSQRPCGNPTARP